MMISSSWIKLRERERERERGEQENGWMLDDAEELATLHVNCVIDLIV
jgi:hypothetical protein